MFADGEMKPMCTMYPRQIQVPRPDYASRYGRYKIYVHVDVQCIYIRMQCTYYSVVWELSFFLHTIHSVLITHSTHYHMQ